MRRLKPPGPEAAARFVARRFPHCNVAILTGSTVRGEETPRSDLDILLRARFTITNHLLDLEGGLPPADAVFAVNELANALHELVLRANGCWAGRGRRILRALEQHDPAFAKRFGEAFLLFGANRDAAAVVQFADGVLASFGGRLFEGYSTRGEAFGRR